MKFISAALLTCALAVGFGCAKRVTTAGDLTLKQEISIVSVGLFHNTCLSYFRTPKLAADFLSTFPELPPEKAKHFLNYPILSKNSEVRALSFPKANFVVILDRDKSACHLLSNKLLDFPTVKARFEDFMETANASQSSIKVFVVHKEIANPKQINMVYELPNYRLLVVASGNPRDQKASGDVGAIYTIALAPDDLKI